LHLMASLGATRQSPEVAPRRATARGNCPSHPARGSHIGHRPPEHPCRLPGRGAGLERSHGPFASPLSCVAPKSAEDRGRRRRRGPVLSGLHDASLTVGTTGLRRVTSNNFCMGCLDLFSRPAQDRTQVSG
jgi:hypothetical protein